MGDLHDFDLGIAGFRPLPQIARTPGTWHALSERLKSRPFLHSEGLSTILGPPQLIEPDLFAKMQVLVRRFDAFYRGVIQAFYDRADCRDEFLLHPIFERAIEEDG